MNLERLLKPPPPDKTSSLQGAHIWKVKLPGRPIRKMTSAQFKDAHPRLWPQFRELKPGETKIISVRRRGQPRAKLGVQFVHPREMSMEARARICPAGIRGDLRRMFIEEGITPTEYRATDQFQMRVQASLTKSLEEYFEAHPEERTRRQDLRDKRRATKNKELVRAGKPPKIDYSKFISPGRIAEVLDVDPLEVRKFLRKHRIGKRGGRYAFKNSEAKKIIRAFRKEQRG